MKKNWACEPCKQEKRGRGASDDVAPAAATTEPRLTRDGQAPVREGVQVGRRGAKTLLRGWWDLEGAEGVKECPGK